MEKHMKDLTNSHKLYLIHRPTSIPETVSVTSVEALWLNQGLGTEPSTLTLSERQSMFDRAFKSILSRTGTYYGDELYDIDKATLNQPHLRPVSMITGWMTHR